MKKALALVLGLSLLFTFTWTAAASQNCASAAEVLRHTNTERSWRRRPALCGDHVALNAAAQLRAEELAQRFSHTRPDGSSWFTVFEEFGIAHRGIAENIAMGHRSSSAVVRAWMNSRGHRSNIMGQHTHVGIGFYRCGAGRNHWVQLFLNDGTATAPTVWDNILAFLLRLPRFLFGWMI